MSDIPEARDRLKALAHRTRRAELPHEAIAAEILAIEKLLYRRRSRRRRAPTTRQPMTAKLRDRIKAFAKLHAELNLDQIAYCFDVDGGRVSEVLLGDHDHLERPF